MRFKKITLKNCLVIHKSFLLHFRNDLVPYK